MLKQLIQKKLESYVVKYFKAHPEVKLVAVAGSVGKTSTKRALGTILAEKYRVRMHLENHNTELSVPTSILGVEYPKNVHNVFAWLKVFRAAHLRIKQPTDVDVIVQELGTDHPGDMAVFGRYLQPDISLITAVTPEHMEFFGSIEAVAAEEFGISAFSKCVLINRDDVNPRFADLEQNANFYTYGTAGSAEYRFEELKFTFDEGFTGNIITPNLPPFQVRAEVVGGHSLRPITGATAVALLLGMTPQEITAGIAKIRSVPGRMNMIRGIQGTYILDDTYNSSPAAAAAALQTLYSISDAAQRIAVLGDMRELGASSQAEHEALGDMCDPNLLSWVVTVGPDTEKYLAPIARRRGCQVHVAKNAIDAGAFVRSVTMDKAVILVKGSQNEIFLEECVKVLCNLSEDEELVRQTPKWMEIKNKFFSRYE